MCLLERAYSGPGFDVGIGHGRIYRHIEDNIVSLVVNAFRGRSEQLMTAGGIARRIVGDLDVPAFYLVPERVENWVEVFQERTGRKVLEEDLKSRPKRYRCVYDLYLSYP